MRNIRKIIAPAIIASLALGAAVPASAAPWHDRDRGRDNYRQQISQLDKQVQRAEQRRLISSREAKGLERKVDQLQQLHRTFARDGLNRAERRALDTRIDNVQRQIARETADRNGRRR